MRRRGFVCLFVYFFKCGFLPWWKRYFSRENVTSVCFVSRTQSRWTVVTGVVSEWKGTSLLWQKITNWEVKDRLSQNNRLRLWDRKREGGMKLLEGNLAEEFRHDDSLPHPDASRLCRSGRSERHNVILDRQCFVYSSSSIFSLPLTDSSSMTHRISTNYPPLPRRLAAKNTRVKKSDAL